MKTRLLMIFAAILIFTGCHKEIKLEVKKIVITETDSLWNIKTSYPVFSSTEEWAENSCTQVNDKLTAFVGAQRDSLILNVRLFAKDMEAIGESMAGRAFDLVIQDTVLLANEDYISVRLLVYAYTGGAHGITSFYSFNYDLKKQQFLTDKEILDYQKIQELTPLLKAHLKNPENCFNEAPTGENFSALNFTRDSLEFTYAQYILGPYSCGYTTISIPREKLKGMLLIK